MKTNLLALFCLITLAGCSGCGKSPVSDSSTTQSQVPAAVAAVEPGPIAKVRTGVLANYNTTTVGKAFEGTFENPKWTTFDTPKGQTVVQFDGTIAALKLSE